MSAAKFDIAGLKQIQRPDDLLLRAIDVDARAFTASVSLPTVAELMNDILVDGYNLMHAAGYARERYGRGELERLRNSFLAALAERLDDPQRRRTTVVFDAQDAPDDVRRRYRQLDLLILFAGGDGIADEAIEKRISSHSAPSNLLVVSSDRRIRDAARRRGARDIGSEDYWDRLAREFRRRDVDEVSQPDMKRTGDILGTNEVDYWLKEFGDDLPQTSGDVDDSPTNSPRSGGGHSNRKPDRDSSTKHAAESDAPTVDSAEASTSDREPQSRAGDIDYWQSQIDDVIREERNSDKR
ncbi:NYN domain-containing protein [Stratiformator vulcanicus]|uniref:YacP-like NYN domain protein n=1 Tax=Stratiformator vulcanicus TaxID=2527980 RepID=A0A517R2E5_9PLAN|nr:NYN domain-containing protein [Stratiformator vulcanicus]QDT38056.1 YacP-like NYN domain protein [Stratiformator vulcanicus]